MMRAEEVIRETIAVHERLAEQSAAIEGAGGRLAGVLRKGGTIYVAGNGGSAADAQHMACELVGRFMRERAALPCIALTTDTSVLTSVGNDYGFGDVFRRQVEAHVREGDALVLISTSGSSPNVVSAARAARAQGALTVALTGEEGGELAAACELAIKAPARSTPRVQSVHGTIVHIWCEQIEGATSDAGGARNAEPDGH
jgi:D-sedoheptulose 7-phosphate isomerase